MAHAKSYVVGGAGGLERIFSPGPGGSKSSTVVYPLSPGAHPALHLLEETVLPIS